MQTLDGNAVAGALYELFGIEMTTQTGVCRSCGTRALLAELDVYAKAPGVVARCRNCGNVVFVLVEVHGAPQIHLDGLMLSGGVSWLHRA